MKSIYKNQPTQDPLKQSSEIPSTQGNFTSPQYLTQYNQFFSKVNIVDHHQAITKLLNNKIYLTNNQTSSKNKFVIKNYDSTLNHQVITLNVQIDIFELEIIILNQQKYINYSMDNKTQLNKIINKINSPMHRQSLIGFGSSGSIYQFYLNQQNSVCKCIKFETIFQKYQKFTKQSKQQMKKMIFVQVLKQYCFLKILSALQIAPCINQILGFDLFWYNECIEFTMEKCYKNTQISYVNIEQQLKQALKLMHSLKIVHRDIKPDNTIYSPTFNKYVFCDFGISKFLYQEIGQKSLTSYAGTPAYMSNEMKNIKVKQNISQIQYIDLYYNDLVGLKKTLKQIQEKPKFLNIPFHNKQHDQNLGLIMIKFKFLLFRQQLSTIYAEKNLLLPVKYHCLEFLLELSPNEILRKFYINYFKYDSKKMNNKVAQTLNMIYAKKIVKTYKIPINKQKILEKQKLIKLIQSLKLKYISSEGSQSYLNKNQIEKLIQLNQKISFNQYYQHYIIYLSSSRNTIKQKIKLCDCLIARYKEYLIQSQTITQQNEQINKILTSLTPFNKFISGINEIQKKKNLLRNYIDIIFYYFPVINITNQFIQLLQATNNQLQQLQIIYQMITVTRYVFINLLQQYIHQKYKSKCEEVSILAKIILDIIYFQRSKIQFKEIQILPLQHLGSIIDQLNNLKSYYKKKAFKIDKIIFLTQYNQMNIYFNFKYFDDGFTLFQHLTCYPNYQKWKHILLSRAYHILSRYYLMIGDVKKANSLKGEFSQRQQDLKMAEIRFAPHYELSSKNKQKNQIKSIRFFKLIYSQKFKILHTDIKIFLLKQFINRDQSFYNLNESNQNYKQVMISYLQQFIERFQSLLKKQIQPNFYERIKLKLFQLFKTMVLYHFLRLRNLLSQKIIVQSLFQYSKQIILKKLEFYINLAQKYFGQHNFQCIRYKYKILCSLDKPQQAFNFIAKKLNNSKITISYLQTLDLFYKHLSDLSTFRQQKFDNLKLQNLMKYYSIIIKINYPRLPLSSKFAQLSGKIYLVNNNFEQFFRITKWLALMSHKYNSQLIYGNYLNFVKNILTFDKQQLLLCKIDLIINCQFYKIESGLKQLSLFFIYFLSKIYKRITAQMMDKLMNRVCLTLNLVKFQTKQKCLGYIFSIRSYFAEKKRKTKILKVLQIRNTVQKIKEKQINSIFNSQCSKKLKLKMVHNLKRYNKLKINK